MLRSLKQFIAGLQASDEARKQRWIMAATAFTMLFVAVFWLSHLNSTIKGVNIGAGVTANNDSGDSGFVTTMKRGGAVVLENLSGFVKTKIETKKEIDIESPHMNFQAPGIRPVEPRDIR